MTKIANRYETSAHSSKGGMSEVIVCRDTHLDRDVVLKRLQGGVGQQRLIDEQKALLKLRSKHVVQLLDIVKTNAFGIDENCLVLEYIDGADVSAGSFAANEEYVKSLWQIATGIADIHKAGVIHRDIKPNNIRKDTMGVLKIFDFGLAREVGKDDKTRNIIGTPGYMAPELGGATTMAFSPAGDVYAFGATAVALLTKNLPPELLHHQQVTRSYLDKLMPGLHPDLLDAIQKCTSLAATDRPRMGDVRDLLQRLLLKDRHRARIVSDAKVYELNASNRRISLKSSVGAFSIDYDGFNFVIASVSGDVFINNKPATVGQKMHSACVITIGQQGLGRAFLTFDVSNPEVLA